MMGIWRRMGRRSTFIVGILIGALIAFPVLLRPTVYPATDYGDICLWNELTGIKMDDNSILNVQAGDYIVAWLMDDPDDIKKPTDKDFTATLYLDDGSISGLLIEDGRDKEAYDDTYSIRWWFDLKQCHQGTFTYFIRYFAFIESDIIVCSDSFKFQITNGQMPIYDVAVYNTVIVDNEILYNDLWQYYVGEDVNWIEGDIAILISSNTTKSYRNMGIILSGSESIIPYVLCFYDYSNAAISTINNPDLNTLYIVENVEVRGSIIFLNAENPVLEIKIWIW